MPGGFGYESFVGWGEESAWGTPVVPAKYAELISESMNEIRDRQPRPVARGLDVREGNFYDRLFGASGSFDIEMNYIGLLRLLEHAFGDASGVTTVGEAAIRWIHTFSPKKTLMSGKGLSLHINKDVDNGATPQVRYAGFKVNALTFAFTPDNNARLSVAGAAKDFASIAVSTPTFPAAAQYVAGHQTTVEIDDVAREVDAVEITMDNGMNLEKRVLGSKNIAEPIRGDTRRSVRGSLTMDAVAADLAKLDAGTLFKLEVICTGPTLGAANFKLQLVALKCLVTGAPFHVTTPGRMKSTLDFIAEEPTSGELFQAIVDNNESAIA